MHPTSPGKPVGAGAPPAQDLRSILEWAIASLDEGVIITDPEGQLLFVNSAAERVLHQGAIGAEPSDWPRAYGFYLPDRRTLFPADRFPLTEALRGENVTAVEIFVRNNAVPDGIWISASGTALRDDSGQVRGAILTFRDITSQKVSDQRLRRERDWGTAIIETIGTLVLVLNREGRIVGFNRACELTTGYAFEELQGRIFWEVLALPEEVEGVRRMFEDLRSGMFPSHFENHWVTKDGRRRVIAWTNTAMAGPDGLVEYVIKTGMDVTERRRAEDDLRQANQMLRAIIETSPIAIVTMDLAGTVTSWSRAAEKMFGWQAAEVVGRAFPAIPADDEEFFRANLRNLSHGETIAGVERQRRRKDGTLMDVALWNAPQRDGGGNVIGAVSVIADMTDRKRLEEQFRQAQKMEAVGRLAGSVAHDFNNLLTVINGYTQMLMDGVEADHPMRGYVEEIVHAGESAVTLTNQLLAFSRRQIVSLQVLDLNTLVGALDTLLHRLIGEDITLITALAPALPKVKVDAGQFQQVMMNLVVNARDAMIEGGTLTIETGTADIRSQTPEGVPPGHYVLLSVSDTGKGMNEEVKRKIFEPFFTTKGRGKGTGLGLSTVYGIVKQAGGEVTVESEPGAGSMFRIYLPAIERAVAAGAENGSTDVPQKKCTETVLLAESQPAVRKLVREVLEGKGYTVLHASDAHEALGLSGSYGETIHLLVAELPLPGSGGRDLVARITAARPKLKVLYLSRKTGHPLPPGSPEGAHVIEKPFTPEELLAKVRDVLDRG